MSRRGGIPLSAIRDLLPTEISDSCGCGATFHVVGGNQPFGVGYQHRTWLDSHKACRATRQSADVRMSETKGQADA